MEKNRIKSWLWTPLVLVLAAGCVTPPPAKPRTAPEPPSTVHTGDFWWGTSTSAYQNEDRAARPGSPDYFETDWDIFARQGLCPPRGEDAVFSWTHFDEDLRALKKLGVTHYRFSVEWARIEPEPGRINQAALNRYAAMARKLRAAGIEPVVTLWHFTFPSWAYDPKRRAHSNFLYPGIDEAWKAHVARCVAALRPHVRIWIPQNEPNGALPLGYLGAYWPPGLLLRGDLYKRAMANSVQMFRDAAAIIHERQPGGLVLGSYSLPLWRKNRWRDPTLLMYHIMRRTNFDHLDRTYDVCDLIGVNYYYTQEANIFGILKDSQGEVDSNYTQLGWEIKPEGMYRVLVETARRYGKPLVVTENGLATLSEQKKIRYFREHITQMRRAMADGADIRGYFAWTLVDNYEWQEGWGSTFGLAHLDPRTKERVIEPSGRWYREFIRAHRQP